MSDTRRTFLARIAAACTAVSAAPATALIVGPAQLAPRRRLTDAQESLIKLLRQCVCVQTDETISSDGFRRYHYTYRYAPDAVWRGLQPSPSPEELAEIGIPVSGTITATPTWRANYEIDIEVEWIVPGNHIEESNGNHHLQDHRQGQGGLGRRRGLGHRA